MIPKNIRVKREIFKNYGIKEVVIIGISLLLGFILSKFFGRGLVKVFLFSLFPILSIIITLPIGNSNVLNIIIKMFKFKISQKKYKKYK